MIFLRWLAAVPTALHGLLVTALWWLSFPFTERERQLILSNIERVYQMRPQTSFAKTFVRQVLESQLRVYIETIQYVFKPERVTLSEIYCDTGRGGPRCGGDHVSSRFMGVGRTFCGRGAAKAVSGSSKT